jgi:predicted Zn finger-like uncharacterized protein
MRFACDGCDAKYMISDDKVGPAGVKVRCKKCGHLILVRRAEPETESAGAAGDGLAAEWWVAIDDQPVGPVDLEVVRNHWDAGEIGPDSLVWYAGLAEWSPLSSVPELHSYLSGTLPPAALAAPAAPEPTAPEPPLDREWRPGAASALAALEESDARPVADRVFYPPEAPEPAGPSPAAPVQAPFHARDGVGAGADPTGVVPLPIQGLERTGEKRIAHTPGPRGPAARRPAASVRRKESSSLTVVLVVALVVVAAVAAGLWWLTK